MRLPDPSITVTMLPSFQKPVAPGNAAHEPASAGAGASRWPSQPEPSLQPPDAAAPLASTQIGSSTCFGLQSGEATIESTFVPAFFTLRHTPGGSAISRFSTSRRAPAAASSGM